MLEKIEKPVIETVKLKPDGTYGMFTLEPLECGYGNTLGNSLRRVLLSSLPGVAVTSVKIDGVQHEFSTIPGVKEDVTEIILNIKGLIAKMYGECPKTVYIEAEGECDVTAGDIKTDSEIEILDPGMHIATLGPGAKLYMEITLDKGRGYVSAEKNKQQLQPVIGIIAVDSIYTPVLKVNYTVENTRVGQRTDYDKLILEVWTDGTISAKEAVSYAAKLLVDHLQPFVELSDEAIQPELMADKSESGKDKLLEMTIDDLDLSVRSFNCLKRANSTSGDGSEKAYGSQSGADKRTDAQNSKTRLHIPPVILKTSLCVIFLTALTAIIVYIKRRRNILWEARLAKRVKKGRYSRAAIMINNRIYKGLGHPSKNKTDELYLANLKEKYCGPDYCGIHWDEYMRIIQKAVYSSEGITGEECFMVVETWRRLEKKDIRHNSQKNMYKNSMINKK